MRTRRIWRTIPKQLRNRKKEILGEIRGNQMIDCVYNACLAGEVFPNAPLENVKDFLPDFLKDYQYKDLSLSLTRKSVFNINKPGYGKTLETILWIKVVLQKDFKVLILCPKSVISSWTTQLNKYWPDWLECGTWWITNYEQLYNEERFKRATEFAWDTIVLDESHKIKSFRSKITERVFKLKGESKHCLTGTPVRNRPEDIAAQLKWLDSASITNFTDFQFAFCNFYEDRWGRKPCGLTKDKQMVDNLQKLLELYTVGGEEHYCDKPNLIKIRLNMYDNVKKLYKKVVGEYDKQLKCRVVDTESLLEQGIKVSSAAESAIRRQQLASNPQLFNERFKNIKFEWIADWLEGTDEKVIIFSKYAKTIEQLKKYLESKKCSIATVERKHSRIQRDNIITTWKESKQALLGTLGVLGEGVDGLQEVCKYAIFVDRAWTASENQQAEKRIDRIGKLGTATIYILQAIGTIDILIERKQHIKGLDAEMLLDYVTDYDE